MNKTIQKLTDSKKNLTEQDPENLLYLGIAACAGFSIVFIGGALAVGLISGLFIGTSILLLVFKAKKFKPRLWNTMCDHPVLTDVILSLGVMGLMSSGAGITAFVAGGSAGLVSSFAIKYFTEKQGKVIDQESKLPYESYKIPFMSKNKIEEDNTVVVA